MDKLKTINGQLELAIHLLKNTKEFEGTDKELTELDERQFDRLKSEILATYRHLRLRNGKEI